MTVMWSEAPRWGRGRGLVRSSLGGVNKVQSVVSPWWKVYVLGIFGNTLFRSAWLKSPAKMRKASGWAVCCSLMCWYRSFSASLLLLLELGGMYTATSSMAVYSLGGLERPALNNHKLHQG